MYTSKYTITFPYASREMNPTQWKEFHAEETRVIEMFKRDLLTRLGILNHPEAELLFAKAWELGHSSSLNEVASQATDLADLLN